MYEGHSHSMRARRVGGRSAGLKVSLVGQLAGWSPSAELGHRPCSVNRLLRGQAVGQGASGERERLREGRGSRSPGAPP